jgi:hypothetical protein
MSGLKASEIHWVVNSYIGVSGGYLGDFTYRSHREFYPAFCDLDLDPETYSGTTRERFVALLSEAEIDQFEIKLRKANEEAFDSIKETGADGCVIFTIKKTGEKPIARA